MITTADGMTYQEVREEWIPTQIVKSENVFGTEELLKIKPASISFQRDGCVRFEGTGSYVILDFGKELCGGIRVITRDAKGMVKWRITFGESLTECCERLGKKMQQMTIPHETWKS